MAKKLNPMPPSAKWARRIMWIQVVLTLLAGGGLFWAHRSAPDLVPNIAANNVYRAVAGLAAGAVVVLLLTFLMRYQWRWVWLLSLVIELAVIGGLIWLGVKGFSWFAVVVLGLVAVIVFFTLLGRVSRRWFHH